MKLNIEDATGMPIHRLTESAKFKVVAFAGVTINHAAFRPNVIVNKLTI